MEKFPKHEMAWLNNTLMPELSKSYIVKHKNVPNSYFGECIGIDFDNQYKTGYMYFWSSGMVGFGLFDIEKNESTVEQEFVEIIDLDELANITSNFLSKL